MIAFGVTNFGPGQGHQSERTSPKIGNARLLKRTSIAILAALVAALAAAIAILLTNANILRSPIARFLSGALDRPVAINGDLRVKLFKDPRLEINGLTVGNAQWGSRPAMVEIERAVIRIRPLRLLQGRIVLPEVELTRPDVLLETNADGTPNWRFGDEPPASAGRWGPPEIHALSIREGRLQYRDPTTRSDVVLQIESDRAAADAESRIRFVGSGRLRDREFELEGRAASLLQLNQNGKPYALEVRARAGDTKATFDGTVVPLKLETIDGRLELSGKDLSKLYPLVPVALPWTSSYRVAGHFLREGRKFTLRDLTGRVGGSDIQGSVSLDLTQKRPFLTADVTSRRLDYKDLAGFLGAPPPAKGERRPADQEREAAVRQATGKVLPAKPYDVTRLRVFDADVHFKAKSIISRGLPLDNMVADLKLKDGTLVLSPLDFGVAGGHVTSQVTLDARNELIATKALATATNLEAKALLPALKRSAGSAGKVGGRAELSTTGNSIAAMAASANGEVALIMAQGRASTLSLVLVNLDLANATKYLLYGDPNAPVHCAVIIGRLHDGRFVPQTFVDRFVGREDHGGGHDRLQG